MLENCSLVKAPVGVTPVSKKHSPPNDRPISFTLCMASMKAAVTAGLLLPRWPFQSDHSVGSNMFAVIGAGVWVPLTSRTSAGFDHQNWV